MLASNPSDEHKKIARKVWAMSREYDFCDDEMYCDRALHKLDLARKGVDPGYPEDGEVWIYGPIKGRRP